MFLSCSVSAVFMFIFYFFYVLDFRSLLLSAVCSCDLCVKRLPANTNSFRIIIMMKLKLDVFWQQLDIDPKTAKCKRLEIKGE